MSYTPRAAVVMMRGTGEQRLQQAIAQGLLQEDFIDDVQAVLKQAEETNTNYGILTAQYNQLQHELQGYRTSYREAVMAQQRETARKTRWDDFKAFAILLLIVFVMVFGSVLLSKIILN